jgi:hypothetical protein
MKTMLIYIGVEKYFANEAWYHILDLVAKQRKKVNGYALDAGRLSNVKTAFHVIDVLI